ncbi:leucine rich repeat domain-containing protein [Pholiota molesta]|nr:leucine rich repeat domain-containing protein [Pholiota molesta]
METQAGDTYLRDLAAFVRRNDKGLAESGLFRRRRHSPSDPSPFLPLAWLSPSLSPPPRTRPSRPMSYASIYSEHKDPETMSLASFRSSLSMVSNISLAGGWWSPYNQPTIDAELKYLYSTYGRILERNANLQRLECDNIDPRTLLGWDLLAFSLKSLKIRKSGLQDISEIFVGAVLEDQARREGTLSQQQQRQRTVSSNSTPKPLPQPSLPPIQDEPEVEGDHESTPVAPAPSTRRDLSPAQWASLKHLYLPDNALTFIPAHLLLYLTSITHLDLSANLFVSVPPGLEELYNLTSLNLSDNLIDSVLGIYLNLGQLIYLNISHNRLESLCGLERLLALERVDLRGNLLEETLEIGRLVVLPNISELWIEGNPFVEIEESYRIHCFDYFWKEGKEIILDGTHPTMYERRNLSSPDHTKSILPLSTSSSAPVITIEPSHSQVFSASLPTSRTNDIFPNASPSSTSDSASVVTSGRRQKKSKRIVNLDGTPSNQLFPSSVQSRLNTVQVSEPQDASMLLSSDKDPKDAELNLTTRSFRHHTEHAPSGTSLAPLPENRLPYSLLSEGSKPNTPLSRSEARKARQSASVFEAGTVDDGDGDVDAYRKTIESLKKDMGDSWLKVYNQTQS